MSKIGEEQYTVAFDMMIEHWPLPKEEIQNLAYQTKSQLTMVASRFGSVTGTEFIRSDEIGESYRRFIYIQKFERHATRWMIVFYKPREEWVVNAVYWDDKTTALFDL